MRRFARTSRGLGGRWGPESKTSLPAYAMMWPILWPANHGMTQRPSAKQKVGVHSLVSDWLSRWRQQQVYGHGALPLRMAADATLRPPSVSADAEWVDTRAHYSPSFADPTMGPVPVRFARRAMASIATGPLQNHSSGVQCATPFRSQTPRWDCTLPGQPSAQRHLLGLSGVHGRYRGPGLGATRTQHNG